MTPGSCGRALWTTALASGGERGAGGSDVISRLGDVEIRKRDTGLHQRSLAHHSSANREGGGPKPSHLVRGLSSRSGSTSSTTQPRTERLLKSTRTRSPSPTWLVRSVTA